MPVENDIDPWLTANVHVGPCQKLPTHRELHQNACNACGAGGTLLCCDRCSRNRCANDGANGTEGERCKSITQCSDRNEVHDADEGGKRATIWNKVELRKLSGNSAPFRQNLEEYFRAKPDWEEYAAQDKMLSPSDEMKECRKRKKWKTRYGKESSSYRATMLTKRRLIQGSIVTAYRSCDTPSRTG